MAVLVLEWLFLALLFAGTVVFFRCLDRSEKTNSLRPGPRLDLHGGIKEEEAREIRNYFLKAFQACQFGDLRAAVSEAQKPLVRVFPPTPLPLHFIPGPSGREDYFRGQLLSFCRILKTLAELPPEDQPHAMVREWLEFGILQCEMRLPDLDRRPQTYNRMV